MIEVENTVSCAAICAASVPLERIEDSVLLSLALLDVLGGTSARFRRCVLGVLTYLLWVRRLPFAVVLLERVSISRAPLLLVCPIPRVILAPCVALPIALPSCLRVILPLLASGSVDLFAVIGQPLGSAQPSRFADALLALAPQPSRPVAASLELIGGLFDAAL